MQVACNLICCQTAIFFKLLLHNFFFGDFTLLTFTWFLFIIFFSLFDQEDNIFPIFFNILEDRLWHEILPPQKGKKHILDLLRRIFRSMEMNRVVLKNKMKTIGVKEMNTSWRLKFLKGGKGFKVHKFLCAFHPLCLFVSQFMVEENSFGKFEVKKELKTPIMINDLIVGTTFLQMETFDIIIFRPSWFSLFQKGSLSWWRFISLFLVNDCLFLFYPFGWFKLFNFGEFHHILFQFIDIMWLGNMFIDIAYEMILAVRRLLQNIWHISN